MSTPPLVFMDTETTGLSLADDIRWLFCCRRVGGGVGLLGGLLVRLSCCGGFFGREDSAGRVLPVSGTAEGKKWG